MDLQEKLANLDKQIDTRTPNKNGLKIRDLRWSVKTAGPSPFNNERVELFLLGCHKAMSGNPCKGCFNSTTWDNSKALYSHDPILVAKHINQNAEHKYITIGGGEPTDQIYDLIILCKELKKYGFHIMVYTWHSVLNIIREAYLVSENPPNVVIFNYYFIELLKYVDIIVDGEFQIQKRLWDGSKEDGFLSSVGSGNQIIWDIKNRIGYAMEDLCTVKLDKDNNLHFFRKPGAIINKF